MRDSLGIGLVQNKTNYLQKAAVETCYHCGLPCPQNNKWVKSNHSFCCQGCLSVFEILSTNGLHQFYQLSETPGKRKIEKDFNEFEYLNSPEIFEQLIDYQEKNQTLITLHIPQIHCISCIWLLENLNLLQHGISKSRVNFLQQKVRIYFDHQKISLSNLVGLLSQIGYEPELNLSNLLPAAKTKSSKKSIVNKIGVAGFCFGNVMMLSFPEYISTDVPQAYAGFFSLVMILFSLPVLFYCARNWFTSAFASIGAKRINMDLPICIGITVLFLQSLINIFFLNTSGYLDSLCGFVFFLLISKWFQQKTYHHLQFQNNLASYFPLSILKIINGLKKSVPISQIAEGDHIFLRSKEVLPVKSELVNAEALFDYSFITGESDPIKITKGEKVFAGGRAITSGLELIVKDNVKQSLLRHIWEDSGNEGISKNSFADQFAPYFTSFVVGIAAILGGYHWVQSGLSNGLIVFSSILIITCPCALAISEPLVKGIISRLLAQKGFFVKDHTSLDKFHSLKHYVFDKTGTLTSGTKDLNLQWGKLTNEELGLVASLGLMSIHPIGKKLSDLSDTHDDVHHFCEVISNGMKGQVKGHEIAIGKIAWLKTLFSITIPANTKDSDLAIMINNELKAIYLTQDNFREGWQDSLKSFLQKGDAHLISGDHSGEKKRFQGLLKDNHIHFELKPDGKKKYIQSLQKNGQRVLMVGDGINDQEAMNSSDVSVAVVENNSHFNPSCHAIINANSFASLPSFIQICQSIPKVIHRNWMISAIYNVFGVLIAGSGLLNPLFAAILMPISSVTVAIAALIGCSFLMKGFK